MKESRSTSTTAAEDVAAITARLHLDEAVVRVQAFRDKTTGLPNRRALRAWVDAQDRRAPLTALLVDFDGLRWVNNAIGPEAGDELLRRVASCIDAACEAGELAARLHGSGGDEFVLLYRGGDEGRASSRAAALEAQLAAVELPGELVELYGGGSVGWAIRRAGEAAEPFLDRAADVMRTRKQQRKDLIST